MNEAIVYSETTKRWVKPRREKYKVYVGSPIREGDWAVIEIYEVNETPIKCDVWIRKVNVMLERSSSGHFWLVER